MIPPNAMQFFFHLQLPVRRLRVVPRGPRFRSRHFRFGILFSLRTRTGSQHLALADVFPLSRWRPSARFRCDFEISSRQRLDEGSIGFVVTSAGRARNKSVSSSGNAQRRRTIRHNGLKAYQRTSRASNAERIRSDRYIPNASVRLFVCSFVCSFVRKSRPFLRPNNLSEEITRLRRCGFSWR